MKPYELALSQYGVKEIPGEKDNPVIVNYFNEIGQKWVKDDETAWCSAFVNYCCKKTGYPMSGELNARSWLEVGKEASTPKLGDIVVFWRTNRDSWKGHVGFYIGENDYYIFVLGGNQDNMVCVAEYPKYRLLQYRRLEK